MSLDKIIQDSIKESIAVKTRVMETLEKEILSAGMICSEVLKNGGRIFLCGNGGSSCDASHIAAELVVRFKTNNNRPSLPAISLSGDASIITACANDNGYDEIFSRQIEGLGKEGDLLIGISTSGNSTNVIKAMETARAKGMKTVAFLGKDGGRALGLSDIDLVIPAEDTGRIQESHIMLGHILCAIIEKELFGLS